MTAMLVLSFPITMIGIVVVVTLPIAVVATVPPLAALSWRGFTIRTRAIVRTLVRFRLGEVDAGGAVSDFGSAGWARLDSRCSFAVVAESAVQQAELSGKVS